jgi:hypothetical protein
VKKSPSSRGGRPRAPEHTLTAYVRLPEDVHREIERMAQAHPNGSVCSVIRSCVFFVLRPDQKRAR